MSMEMNPESIQRMMLTPKMLLSMHVLQLNIMDLKMFIQAELEENPLLEEEVPQEKRNEDESRLNEGISRLIDEDAEGQAESLVAENTDALSQEKKEYLDSLIVQRESLYDHLLWQLRVLAKDEEESRIGEFIIGELDENGFLNMDLGEMRLSAKAEFDKFKSALSLIRSFDPVGVGARDLKESLLMQLISSGKKDTNLYRIVYFHLEDLMRGYYEKIAQALSISREEIEKAKQRISYLSPCPAANFSAQETPRIEPDVFFNLDNGSYSVEVNQQDIPKLKINRYYRNILRDARAPESTKEYIRQRLLTAHWFVEALNQRQRTISKVCEFLAVFQNDFLEKGAIAIKPLTLRQVAQPLSVSEATISRVVSNKYAQVFNRLLALKDFFAGSLKTVNGRTISNESVKQAIQSFIEKENPQKPLSDEEIAHLLNGRGIKISRRTVTKYRENLKISSSHLRKLNKDISKEN